MIERDKAIGQNHAFNGRVRDIALVPQRDIFERRRRVGANQPGHADDLLAADRVPLVGHRRRAFLAFAKRLFYLSNFGFLQPANLEREFFERRGQDRKRRHQLRMAIALNDLRRDRRRREAELLADGFFNLRIEVREHADGAGDLAH